MKFCVVPDDVRGWVCQLRLRVVALRLGNAALGD